MKAGLQEKERVTRSRSGKDAGTPTQALDQDVMKQVEAAATPGAAHRALNVLVGEWNAEVKCWQEADGDPHVSQGTATVRWKFDGRFLEEEFHGEMMGKPFVGEMLVGYDNTKQVYNSVWISDAQTSMFTSEGKGDSSNRVITQEGTSSCPATGRTEIPTRTVLRILSPDKHVFEMFDDSEGSGFKTMEITYTRS